MSIVIRPTPDVFRRTMPLIMVFGAYRPIGSKSPLDAEDLKTITDGVRRARRLHIPLAFLREIPEEASGQAHLWLPECRPRVTDRVFDHPHASAFANREFLSVFTRITDRDLMAIGPRNDSSMRATLAEAKTRGRPISAIIPDHPLQKCSAVRGMGPMVIRASQLAGLSNDIPVSAWAESLQKAM